MSTQHNQHHLKPDASSFGRSPTQAIPLEQWVLPPLPPTVQYFDKVKNKEFTVDTALEEWVVYYVGNRLILKFSSFPERARPVLKRACAHYLLASGTSAEVSKITRLYGVDVAELLETPVTDIKIWWARSGLASKISSAMPARRLLRWCIDAGLGHWSFASQSVLDRLSSTYLQDSGIRDRSMVISVTSQAKITRLLDNKSRAVSTLSTTELRQFVALAWSFQHGMRPVQQITVDLSNVRLYTDIKGERQAHLVFHKAKQREDAPAPLVRQMKPEWVPLLDELVRRRLSGPDTLERVLGFGFSGLLNYALAQALKAAGVAEPLTAYNFRHTAAQLLADAGQPRDLIQDFLGHSTANSAKAYITASTNQAEMLNNALGASKLYLNIESIAIGRFASIEEIEQAAQKNQIAGQVGTRPIAGLGLCSTGQPSCPYNPITSCYGCDKFIPSLDRRVHEEAISGMREQVLRFEHASMGEERSPAYVQLTRPIAVAQQTLDALNSLRKNHEY